MFLGKDHQSESCCGCWTMVRGSEEMKVEREIEKLFALDGGGWLPVSEQWKKAIRNFPSEKTWSLHRGVNKFALCVSETLGRSIVFAWRRREWTAPRRWTSDWSHTSSAARPAAEAGAGATSVEGRVKEERWRWHSSSLPLTPFNWRTGGTADMVSRSNEVIGSCFRIVIHWSSLFLATVVRWIEMTKHTSSSEWHRSVFGLWSLPSMVLNDLVRSFLWSSGIVFGGRVSVCLLIIYRLPGKYIL